MPNAHKSPDPFSELTWDDLNDWAGGQIVLDGKKYQRQGRVSGLVRTRTGGLLAWVDGLKKYATRVEVNADGSPESVCTCPYEIDCKHGVAVVLQYLVNLQEDKRVSTARKNDARLSRFEGGRASTLGGEKEHGRNPAGKHIESFLKKKTKPVLIRLLLDLAHRYPEIHREITASQRPPVEWPQSLITRIGLEIDGIGGEFSGAHEWDGPDLSPDYPAIRSNLERLLAGGYADDVLPLAEALIAGCIRRMEDNADPSNTAAEISACIPVMVRALEQSSRKPAEKIVWVVDTLLKDTFNLLTPFADYLKDQCRQADWQEAADLLLQKLDNHPLPKNTDIAGTGRRHRLCGWAIHALEKAGREKEVIPLCEKEARKSGEYGRLVHRLIRENKLDDAEKWIHKGLKALKDKNAGPGEELRRRLGEIRRKQADWPAVAALHVDAFMRRPSHQAYRSCEKSAQKARCWPRVRQCLLKFLETKTYPCRQKNWPLPKTGLDLPETSPRSQFPMFADLIEIAIYEKKPDRVLHWYDRRPQNQYYWFGLNEDRIAGAVKEKYPDRAVAIWQDLAEIQIAQVKSKAYEQAAVYLRKAGSLMARLDRKTEWDQYLRRLKEKHVRKRRLINILNAVYNNPVLRKRQ